jgi:hypothetical protein
VALEVTLSIAVSLGSAQAARPHTDHSWEREPV